MLVLKRCRHSNIGITISKTIEEREERARRNNRMLVRAKKAWLEDPALQKAYPSLGRWLRSLRAAMDGVIPAGVHTVRFL